MKKLIPVLLVFSLLLTAGAALAKSENANQNGNGNQNITEKENRGQGNAELHRSVVSAFVQNILKVADHEKGIGEQVRLIAKEQNQSATTTAWAIEKVEKRNKIKRFLIGSDYRNLGAMRSELVKTQNRLEKLNQLLADAKTEADKTALQTEIQKLTAEQTRIENFIKSQNGKFSLFGWLVKMFDK